jgi:hypothetical protein
VVVTGVIAIALLLLVFIGATNFVMDEYVKGAVRTAVDEAAQAGAESGGSLSACEAAATQVRANLFPGPFGAGVQISCAVAGDEMLASATGSLPSLVPPVPEVHVSVVGLSFIPAGPTQ